MARLLCLTLAFAIPGVARPQWSIENAALGVALEVNGALTLLDKAARSSWTSVVPAQSPVKVYDVSITKDRHGLRAVAGVGVDFATAERRRARPCQTIWHIRCRSRRLGAFIASCCRTRQA